jgi:hypothetical protein
VAPPLPAQGMQFLSFWSKNSEAALVIWMSTTSVPYYKTFL